jgi:hypothetical protein
LNDTANPRFQLTRKRLHLGNPGLFHHKDERHLICAVPADRTVPDFIAGTAWEFNRTLPDAGPAPIGFDAMAAIHAVRFNGFYLFQSFNE